MQNIYPCIIHLYTPTCNIIYPIMRIYYKNMKTLFHTQKLFFLSYNAKVYNLDWYHAILSRLLNNIIFRGEYINIRNILSS